MLLSNGISHSGSCHLHKQQTNQFPPVNGKQPGFHNTDYATVDAFHYARPTGTNQGKMQRHCTKETKFPSGPKRSIYVSTVILTTL